MEELEGYDYTLAVACLIEADQQHTAFMKSLAEYQAGKTIENLGKAMKK